MIRVLLVVASALLLSASASSQTLGTLAFVHATVIDGTGAAPKHDQTVLVTAGRIAATGDATDIVIPPGTRSIDTTGQFLIPGLWDLHVHTRYKGIDHLRLLLVNGITTARDMAGPWDHLNEIKRWRNEIGRGERIGPRLLTTGPNLDGPGSPWSFAVIVTNPEEGRTAVRRLHVEGTDFVKVYNGLSRSSFFAIAEEARSVGLPFVGHIPFALSVTEVSNAGQQSIEHTQDLLLATSDREEELRSGSFQYPLTYALAAESFDAAKLEAAAIELRQNGTSVVPTLSLDWTRLGHARQDASVVQADRLRYVPPAYRTAWTREQIPSIDVAAVLFERAIDVVGLLHSQGVRLLAGTDVVKPFFVPGFALHDELRLLVGAGLSEMEALQAATRDPARFVGMNEVGTIERGMIADLVILDADPLENIDNTRTIAGVVTTGRLIERNELQEILSEISDEASRWAGVPTGR